MSSVFGAAATLKATHRSNRGNKKCGRYRLNSIRAGSPYKHRFRGVVTFLLSQAPETLTLMNFGIWCFRAGVEKIKIATVFRLCDMRCIQSAKSPLIARFRRRPHFAPGSQFVIADAQVEPAIRHVQL